MVVLHTNFGDITIKMHESEAPNTVKNFLEYANSGFYNGTIFHRVIPGFMVQGGGMDVDMQEKESRESIENEADNGLANDIGTLAMARTNDPHSASSQFFINVANNGFLNHSGKNSQGWGYAVFGKVVEGMDVVSSITEMATGSSGYHQDVPVETIEITETIISDAYSDK